MKLSIRDVWQYTKPLFKELVFWLSLVLFVLDYIARTLGLGSDLPQLLVWGLTILGVYWAGYKVNQATMAKIPAELGVLAHQPPALNLQLVEGYAYFYSFRQGIAQADDARKAAIVQGPSITTDWAIDTPASDMIVHLRIENSRSVTLKGVAF